MIFNQVRRVLRATAILAFASAAASADAGIIITPSAASVDVGQNVTFSVAADDLDELLSFDVNISYDQTRLALVSIGPSSLLPGSDNPDNSFDYMPEDLRFLFSGFTPVSGPSAIFDVVFEALRPGGANFSFGGTYSRDVGDDIDIEGASSVLVNGAVQTPEPGALAMMLLGGVLLAGGRRLRRRTA